MPFDLALKKDITDLMADRVKDFEMEVSERYAFFQPLEMPSSHFNYT